MNVKRVSIIIIIAALLLTGCEQYATHTPSAADLTTIAEQMPPGPTKDAVQATAIARYLAASQAEQTITAAQEAENAARDELNRQTVALTAEAQATITAQDNAARATTQALDVRATTQALDAQATAQARSVQATATAEAQHATATSEAAIVQLTTQARDATATAEADHATATMQAVIDSVEKTRQAAQAIMLQATANAVKRQEEREEAVQEVRTAAPWVGLVLAVAAVVGLTAYFAPVVKRRAQVVRRGADEGEPFVLLERDRDGRERIALPLRSFRALLTPGEKAPDQLQDRTTARAQLANVVMAARGEGKKRLLRQATQPGAQSASVTPPIRVVEAEEVQPWIEDARVQMITGEVLDGNS